MSFAVGVDLGGTNLRIAAVSEQGELLEKAVTETKLTLGRDAVMAEMAAAVRELSAKFGKWRRFLGVGVGVPGIIDQRTGMLRESPNLPGWNDYPVREEIERRLASAVFLENDANCAALGEAWLGAARHAAHMCMITLGTGIGGGLICDGRVWQGMTGMAGEIGHINVDPDGPKCGCGSYGCVEQFASATAVLRMAREAIAAGKAPALAEAQQHGRELTAEIVYDLAKRGDTAAQEIFRKAGRALGILLADLVNALNMQMYVIGGGVSSAWDVFAPAMFEELRRRSYVYAATAPEDISAALDAAAFPPEEPRSAGARTVITRARLGSDAGLFGAARLPMPA
jgi:glucokinase